MISNAASALLDSESAFHITLPDKLCAVQSEMYQVIFEEMDSFLIQYITKYYQSVLEMLHKYIDQESILHEDLPLPARNTYLMVTAALHLLSDVFQYPFLTPEIKDAIIKTLCSSNESYTQEQAIVNEFGQVLNLLIRNESLPLRKKEYYPDEYSVIIWKDYLCIEERTIRQTILPCMKTTQNLQRLIKALKAYDKIYTTKKNMHPISVYTPDGETITIITYSISSSLLNRDNKELLFNSENLAFFMTPSELPERYMPLIQDNRKKVAERILQSGENNHIYVSGNSGQGKSVLLSQIMCQTAKIGDKSICFDMNDSFGYTDVRDRLSEKFVQQHVTYWNIEEKGIPVNLFHLNLKMKETDLKRILYSVLSAPFSSIGDVQRGFLQEWVEDFVSRTALNPEISFIHLLRNYQGSNESEKKLYAKLEPIFKDISDYGMKKQSWDAFLVSSKDIIIITMGNSAVQCCHQLVDMMLATLFEYQLKNSDIPLSIFIDEIQNQNLRGPIKKIMKEGRKYNIAFTGATQPFAKKGDPIGDVMQFASTNIFLKPSMESENDVRAVLGLKNCERFRSMKPGDCFISGPCYNPQSKRNEQATLSGRVYLEHGSKLK